MLYSENLEALEPVRKDLQELLKIPGIAMIFWSPYWSLVGRTWLIETAYLIDVSNDLTGWGDAAHEAFINQESVLQKKHPTVFWHFSGPLRFQESQEKEKIIQSLSQGPKRLVSVGWDFPPNLSHSSKATVVDPIS